mmetsp:Transcript_25948/g.26156  ORF Transcript_25948/g.26156 Transcript_25948/m.26156 type:complete len:950 (+) Transcript_25948:76-2925(+)
MIAVTLSFALLALFDQGHGLVTSKNYYPARTDVGSASIIAQSASSDFVPELKPPPAMYQGAAAIGTAKAAQSPLKTFLLGIIAGCHIGFGAYLALTVGGNVPEIAAKNPGLQKIIQGAFGLPFGLMMVLIGGGELFTGNTALVTAAVLEGKAPLSGLLKNWFFSYSGNFVGSVMLAYLVFIGNTLGATPGSAAAAVAKTSLAFLPAFVRGILCNWLVCMAVYMASGASSTAGKIGAIWFPISSFIALGLEHSVANMFMIPLGMMRGAEVTVSQFLLKNLLPVTLGNIVGGALCVTGMYAATYGSLLKPSSAPTPAPSSAPVSAPSGGSGSLGSSILSLRGGSTTPKVRRTGTSYLPEETLARAKEGNMFEKKKLQKDGTQAWTDVHEYAAAIRSGEIDWKDIASDDMDIRMKWNGMFHRKKATPGKFMMRLRTPNGIISSDMFRYYAEVVRPFGEIGVVDITTRANIQLRGMGIPEASDILKGLIERGQTSIQTGLDNVRNMVGSPLAGIDPHEVYDTRELTKALDMWYCGNLTGNPEWGNLPRKFNMAVSGSRDDFAHTNINDIGLRPVPHAATMEMGFNVVLGGYMSSKRTAEAIPMNVWIPESAAIPLCKSILRLFRDHGARGDRQKARLMWLIEDWGLEKFNAEVLKEMAVYDKSWEGKAAFEGPQPHLSEWTLGHRHLDGVNPQKQEGKSFVQIHVPVGRLYPDECDEIAALADKYSAGEIRLTVEQNVILPNVDNEKVNDLLKEPALGVGKRLSVYPGNIIGNVISCTGAQFCPVAIVETKLKIEEIAKILDEKVEVPHPVRIHMTGCPNSCAQVQIADIGMMGAPAKKENAEGKMKAVPGVNIYTGGKLGEDAFLSMTPEMKGIPMDPTDLVPVLTKLLVERHGGVLKEAKKAETKKEEKVEAVTTSEVKAEAPSETNSENLVEVKLMDPKNFFKNLMKKSE